MKPLKWFISRCGIAPHGASDVSFLNPVGAKPPALEHRTTKQLSFPYRIARLPLFALPAERAHEVAVAALQRVMSTGAARSASRRILAVDDISLHTKLWGLDFPNPVGLAAGFDKAGTSFNALGALGFGFVEIGTVTGQPQQGNPVPRLFRLPADEALLNRMGFNNPGAEAVAARLRRTESEVILGINIGKSKVTPLEQATDDYLLSLELLLPFARYLVVNVSSPNTPGLRSLQDAEPLRELLGAVVSRARALAGTASATPPVLVKLAPDLLDEQIEEAVQIAVNQGISGIVAVNTTISRNGLITPGERLEKMGAGGISGAPLAKRAREVVARIHRSTGGRIPIIGVGGIRSADDAWERITAGANLVQIYTGFVYGGPGLVRKINKGLLLRLRKEGMASIEEAVGIAHS
ncbi:quinone-dependent dihydroorotate dehydrogenase [soil metagenome]